MTYVRFSPRDMLRDTTDFLSFLVERYSFINPVYLYGSGATVGLHLSKVFKLFGLVITCPLWKVGGNNTGNAHRPTHCMAYLSRVTE